MVGASLKHEGVEPSCTGTAAGRTCCRGESGGGTLASTMVASRTARPGVSPAVSKMVAGGSSRHHPSPRQPTWAQRADLPGHPEHCSIQRG